MRFLLRFFLALSFFLPFGLAPMYASHIYSSEISYRHISDSTYKVYVSLYIDCVTGNPDLYAALPDDRIFICAYDAHTLADIFTLTRGIADTAIDMPNPCGIDAPTQCRSLTSIIPGVRKYTFSGSYTLPHQSATWRFICTGSTNQLLGRTSTTNLSIGGDLIILEADLNSFYNNSNPVLGNFMPSYFCINGNSNYTPAAVDPDSDNLSYYLVTPSTMGNDSAYFLDDHTTPLTYKAPYTAAAPLSVVPGSFSFSNATGGMSFIPDKLQRSLVMYSIEERRSGVLIGTSQYEMIVLTESCADLCSIDTNTTIYPVPADKEIIICEPKLIYKKVSVRNILGAFMWEQSITERLTQVNVSRLPVGVYFLILEGEKASHVQKVVIAR